MIRPTDGGCSIRAASCAMRCGTGPSPSKLLLCCSAKLSASSARPFCATPPERTRPPHNPAHRAPTSLAPPPFTRPSQQHLPRSSVGEDRGAVPAPPPRAPGVRGHCHWRRGARGRGAGAPVRPRMDARAATRRAVGHLCRGHRLCARAPPPLLTATWSCPALSHPRPAAPFLVQPRPTLPRTVLPQPVPGLAPPRSGFHVVGVEADPTLLARTFRFAQASP